MINALDADLFKTCFTSWVEALRDVRCLPLDADASEITGALQKLRSTKVLSGLRGAPPADVAAVVDAVLAIAALMRGQPSIKEIDVNPLMVHAKGDGATALDALIITD